MAVRARIRLECFKRKVRFEPVFKYFSISVGLSTLHKHRVHTAAIIKSHFFVMKSGGLRCSHSGEAYPWILAPTRDLRAPTQTRSASILLEPSC